MSRRNKRTRSWPEDGSTTNKKFPGKLISFKSKHKRACVPAIAGSVRGVEGRILQASDINSNAAVRSGHSAVTPAVSTGCCSSTSPAAFDRTPLLFLYDCETTGLNCRYDHIIEIASVVLVPDNAAASVTKSDFSSLCYTSRQSKPGG